MKLDVAQTFSATMAQLLDSKCEWTTQWRLELSLRDLSRTWKEGLLNPRLAASESKSVRQLNLSAFSDSCGSISHGHLASCNVACLLIMLVLERTRDIAILKTMGARPGGILKIFIYQGMGIGAVGTVLGMAIAFVLCEGLLANGITLDPQVYGISNMPVVFKPMDYLMAATGAGVITFFASIFPALRGARLRPLMDGNVGAVSSRDDDTLTRAKVGFSES